MNMEHREDIKQKVERLLKKYNIKTPTEEEIKQAKEEYNERIVAGHKRANELMQKL